MARALTAGMITEVQAASLHPILLFEGEFSSGFTRLWSGIGNLTWNGQTWQGVGHLGSISPIEETGEIRATGAQVALSGIPASLISIMLAEARHGKPGRVYFGALSAAGAVIVDPYLSFAGRLDVPVIEEGADTATIRIAYESRLVDLERPRERRYADEDQKIEVSTDRGFEFVAGLQDKQIAWGRA